MCIVDYSKCVIKWYLEKYHFPPPYHLFKHVNLKTELHKAFQAVNELILRNLNFLVRGERVYLNPENNFICNAI